jgi:multiple sugar transport system ATP-binding protein
LAVVELRGVSKVYPNGVEAVSEVDLTVGEGEFFAVVGPSGSGKSTLLRMIAGLESLSAGSIGIGGRDVSRLSAGERDVAMVFQEPALYPYLSVFDNLAFGLRARGVGRTEVRSRVESVADSLGLTAVLKRRPQTLSGGQRQRVALGRAIVRRPAVFLLDEPLSSLDAPLRASVRADLIDLHARLGSTMIYVTHDQGEALAMGDCVGVMERGRVVQVGAPRDVYSRPATRFVGGFVGNPPMSFLSGVVRDHDGSLAIDLIDGVGVETAIPLPAGRWTAILAERRGMRAELGLRPEHVVLSLDGHLERLTHEWSPSKTALNNSALTRLPGEAEVIRVEFLGNETVATLAVGPSILTARLPGSTSIRRGDTCVVALDLDHASWFDPETGAALELAGDGAAS